MKRIYQILYVLLIPLAFSCGNKKNENATVVHGKFSHTLGETVIFEELTVHNFITIDSVKVDEDGNFEFEVEVTEPRFVVIKSGNNNFTTLLLNKNEDVEFKADIRRIAKTYTVKNSPGSELIWQIEQESNKVKNQFDSLYNYWLIHNNDSNNYKIRRELDSVANVIFEAHKTFRKDLIDNHTGSFASIIALYKGIGERRLFTLENDLDYFEKVANELNKEYPENEHVVDLVTRVNNYKEKKKLWETTEQNLQPGKPAAKLTSLVDQHGKPVNFDSFKGKTLLIYFWNTRNRLNRNENPELAKLYRKYKTKGFDIISIAVDEKTELWLSAVEIDRLTWTNCLATEEVKTLYNIESGYNFQPRSFLIDKDGIIKAKDFNVAELEKLLQDLVN